MDLRTIALERGAAAIASIRAHVVAVPVPARDRSDRRQAATPGVILVMLDHPTAAEGLLNAAGYLADLIGGAHINVLVALVPPASTILSGEEVLTRDKETRLRAQEQTRVAALKATFDSWNTVVSRPQGAADWLVFEAVARDLMVEWGRRVDFIVLERPTHRDYGTTWQAFPAALFETDRPVLVVPPDHATSFGRRVAIAWRDDPHATRAVLSALRCTTRTEAVHLLAGVRPGAAEPRIPEIVVEHGVTADLLIIPIADEPFGRALLHGTHAVGADMLVMGAYAHSPLRELVLGGVTRHVIAHADLPVLMRH